MTLKIHFKNGGQAVVENLQKILHSTGSVVTNNEITDFENFCFSPSPHYAFQGNNTVTVSGNEILYLDFK